MFKKVSTIRQLPITTPYVKVAKVGNAGIITMDRLKAKNVFNYDISLGHYCALKELEQSCKVVIHKSASPDVYCAGGDIVAMTEATRERFSHGAHNFYLYSHLVATYKIPYVALISGMTFGGACGFFSASKYRVATEKTVYCAPEVFVGNFSDCGQAYFLPRFAKNLGTYLAFTGAKVVGYDTKKIGLATHFVESKNLQALENELTKCESDKQVSKVLSDFSTEPSNHIAHYEKHLDKIEKLFVGESVEEIVEKLKLDGSDWSMKNLMIMSRASPLALKISHKILKMCRDMPHQDAMALQYLVNLRNTDKGDLCEGARAYMIEKDQNPVWQTKSLEETTPELVDSFFKQSSHKEDIFTPEFDRIAPEMKYTSKL